MYNFVRLAELYYAGSHGMDIKGPAKGSKYKKVSQIYHCIFKYHHANIAQLIFFTFSFHEMIEDWFVFCAVFFRAVKVLFFKLAVSFFPW